MLRYCSTWLREAARSDSVAFREALERKTGLVSFGYKRCERPRTVTPQPRHAVKPPQRHHLLGPHLIRQQASARRPRVFRLHSRVASSSPQLDSPNEPCLIRRHFESLEIYVDLVSAERIRRLAYTSKIGGTYCCIQSITQLADVRVFLQDGVTSHVCISYHLISKVLADIQIQIKSKVRSHKSERK